MSRTKKHPLTGSKAHSPSCRNNKGCSWCASNRSGSYKDPVAKRVKTDSRWKKGMKDPEDKFNEEFVSFECFFSESL